MDSQADEIRRRALRGYVVFGAVFCTGFLINFLNLIIAE